MSENLPMVNSFPSVQEFQTMKELGKMAVSSGFLPTSIKTPEQAVIIMLKGREIGIPPMQAFSSIAVVNGKPTMSAELMLSMIYRNIPGAKVDFLKTDPNECSISAKRPNGKATTFSFTMEDAKRAGLTGKGPWVTYPAAMLRARCISAMARAMFPDALSGIVYTPEELGAEIDDEGLVLDVTQAEELPKEELPPPEPTNPLERFDEIDSKDFGSYVAKGTKFSGKAIKDIDPFDLDNWIKWMKADRDRLFKMNDHTKEFLNYAEAYLCSIEVK